MKGPAPSKPNARREEGKRAPAPGTGANTATNTGAGAGAAATVGAGAGAGAAEHTGTGNDAGAGAGADAGTWIDPRTGAAAGANTGTNTGAGAAASTETRRGRGRPPGSSANTGGTQTSKAKIQASLDGIEGILLSMHLMASTFLKVPELALSDDEAKKLTTAIARVASHYDVSASDKSLAWVNLAMCAGGIYGTRIWAYQLRTKSEEEAKRKLQQPAKTPYPFPAASNLGANMGAMNNL